MPNHEDEDAPKKAIVETAAKLIKSDIKTLVTLIPNECPNTINLQIDSTLEYIPQSLRYMLQQLLVGKDTRKKESIIGHSIIQAVRPRTVIAPLQLGLVVQMHQHYRSRFLIDSLSAMGYCSSYSEVQRFEENAASTVAPDVLGGQAAIEDTMLLFAADNVDHNIATLDGKGMFHGMGLIAAATPGKQVCYTISRQNLCDLKVICGTKMPIKDYCFAKYTRSNIKFGTLPNLHDADRRIDLLWELSLKFNIQVPNW